GDPLPHVVRPKLDRHQPMHVTLRIARGVPSLRSQLLTTRVRRALQGARKKTEAQAQVRDAPFQIVHFGIEGNHLHLVVEALSRDGLSRGVQGLEVRIARAVNGALGRKGKVFADRYHRRDLGSPTEVRNVLNYVLNNARKHVRHIGHVAYVEASTSGEGFDGWSEPVEGYRWLDGDIPPWPQVQAWTGLLGT